MPVSVHRRRPSAASAPPTSPPRRNRLRRAALAAGVTALGVATLSSTASAASKPFYNAEGLGKITLFWTTSLADAPRFQVIENGAIVDTTGPTTAGAGYFGTLTIPDANLYAAGGTTFTINKVDGSGTVLESSDPLTIPACPDVPPRAA
ncbi:MAG: hypothetical protein REI11_02855, partial [Patulibacter sp.]|nr:hypothetical protein [Patulibacter sp.]